MSGTIAYASVVDNTPKMLWEGAVFRRVILEVAKVDPADVVIHFTTAVPPEARAAVAGPCAIREITPFSEDYGYANKVRALQKPWPGYGAVALLDADMLVLSPLTADEIGDTVVGVPVFGASPPEAMLRLMYRRFGPDRASDWIRLEGLQGEPFTTHRNNLNGGLYLVPEPLVAPFGEAWAREVDRLLEGTAAREGASDSFCDQIAAGLALSRLGLRADHLPVARNCPPSLARHLAAQIIHDFAKFATEDRDEAGHLRTTAEIAASPERTALARIIDEVNASPVGEGFDAYRRFRYALYNEEFGMADHHIGALERGSFPFPPVAADMRIHLAAYQRMAAAKTPPAG